MIYLARHGQTDSNTTHTWQGQSGNDFLNEAGKQQATKLAQYLEDKYISSIIASTLNRAHETAEIISQQLNLDVVDEPLLKEMSYGDLEGNTTEEIIEDFPDIFNKWQEHPQLTSFPNGESFKDIQHRAKSIISAYFYTNENIVLVSHEDMIRSIIVAVSGKVEEYWLPVITNTSLTTFESKNVKLLITGIGETPHL